jgi:hypothetical protein
MFAEGRPPPPMPKHVEEIMSSPQGQQAMGQGMGIGSSGVTAEPFVPGSKAVQSEVVQRELDRLVSEHKQLVAMGEGLLLSASHARRHLAIWHIPRTSNPGINSRRAIRQDGSRWQAHFHRSGLGAARVCEEAGRCSGPSLAAACCASAWLLVALRYSLAVDAHSLQRVVGLGGMGAGCLEGYRGGCFVAGGGCLTRGKLVIQGRVAAALQVEAIEDRWGLFLKRFELMGELNPGLLLAHPFVYERGSGRLCFSLLRALAHLSLAHLLPTTLSTTAHSLSLAREHLSLAPPRALKSELQYRL